MRRGSMEEVDQSPQDAFLCFSTSRKSLLTLNPMSFRVLNGVCVQSGPLFFEGRIIGESDLIVLWSDGVPVYGEILACVDPRQPLHNYVPDVFHCMKHGPTFEHGLSYRTESGIEVMGLVSVRIEEGKRPDSWSLFEGKIDRGDATVFHTAYCFPGPCSPRTEIGGTIKRVEDHRFAIHFGSIHEYPERKTSRMRTLVSQTQLVIKLLV